VLKACAFVAAAWVATAAPDLPLTITGLVTGPKSRVTLTNTAAQPITAWSLATVVQQDSGRVHREVQTVDGYLSELTRGLPGASERLERLMPRQSREFPLDPLPAGASVDVVAVVLDDGTAMGDAEVIQGIFARRVAERDGFLAVVETFNEVLAGLHGEAALDALHDRLSAAAARADSTPVRAALDAVQTYRARGGAPEAIDASLRTYAAFVARQHELAVKHATRR
jgi:hypothetical protein